MVQTRDGYLWLSTYNGLARFDGVRFTVFDDGNTPELRSSRVTSLFEAADGILWIGDESGQVTQYKDGRFTPVPFHAAWSDGKIDAIATDEEGDAWLMNAAGELARVRDGFVLTPPVGVVTKVVSLTQSPDGKIWVAREGRVSELEHGRLRAIDFDTSNTNTYIQGIGASRDGGLWVASDGRLRKWKDGQWVVDLGAAPWGRHIVTSLMETRNGELCGATADFGLYLFFPGRDQKPLHFDHASGFPSDWVIFLCQDREGNTWSGTGAGLVMMRPNNLKVVSPPDQWQGPRGAVGLSRRQRRVVGWNRRRRFVSLSKRRLDEFRLRPGHSQLLHLVAGGRRHGTIFRRHLWRRTVCPERRIV